MSHHAIIVGSLNMNKTGKIGLVRKFAINIHKIGTSNLKSSKRSTIILLIILRYLLSIYNNWRYVHPNTITNSFSGENYSCPVVLGSFLKMLLGWNMYITSLRLLLKVKFREINTKHHQLCKMDVNWKLI